MFFSLRAPALAAGCLFSFAYSPAQSAPDAFAEACAARGKASAAHCACESKLARTTLDAREQAAMIRAMKDDAEGFRAAVAALGEAKLQGFVAKMRKLEARTKAECP